MTAHTLVARLGGMDTAPVTPSLQSSQVASVDFIDLYSRLEFGLGQALEELEAMGLVPGEISMDLALLAATVTAADTRISREHSAQDAWTREIEVCVPVSNLDRWQACIPNLKKTLNFLTGDKWTIQFRPRPPDKERLVPAPETLRTANPDCVCLFSGGLDSFVGAIDLFAEGRSPLLVSHYWDGITSAHQTACADALRARLPDRAFHHIRARVGFPTDTFQEGLVEDTLRARSFLFFALAALAADAIGGNITIHVPENGLISLNVPLDPLRLGALSTRTTHPFYMARVNELFQALGLRCQLLNRYGFSTKGEMLAGCRDQTFLAQHARDTMSCSSPAKTRFARDETQREPKHCGYCVPCLIRRASLVAGCIPDTTPYQLEDLHAQVISTQRAEGMHIRSFELAISRLRENPGRARFDIHRPGPLYEYPHDHLLRYQRVYSAGIEEVAQLLDGVQTSPD